MLTRVQLLTALHVICKLQLSGVSIKSKGGQIANRYRAGLIFMYDRCPAALLAANIAFDRFDVLTF